MARKKTEEVKIKPKARKTETGVATPNEMAAERFAHAVVFEGKTQGDAYRETHPKCGVTGNSLRVRACEYAKTPLVSGLIDEKRRQLRERNAAFGDRLIGYLREEIDTCFAKCQSLEPVIKQANLAADVLGMRRQQLDMTAKVGIDSSEAADKLNFLAAQAKGVKQ